MWGIIPAAGMGTRIQPLAFSKELLPVGSRRDGDTERPRAVSEYLVERMLLAGANKLCFVISPGKSDILSYYGYREATRLLVESRSVNYAPPSARGAGGRTAPEWPPAGIGPRNSPQPGQQTSQRDAIPSPSP